MTSNNVLLTLLIGLSSSLSTIALEVGDQAPNFTLEATDGKTYTLEQLASRDARGRRN